MSAPVPDRKGSRLAALALPGVLALAVVYAALNVGAAFSREGMVTELAVYCELMSQPWDEMGFARTLGMPMLSPVGETVAERHPYIHHPPAGFWPNYFGRTLLGKSEEGYRLFPVVATGLSALLLFLLTRPVAGPLFAFLATLLFLLSPLIQLYGAMPNSEPYTLLFGLVLAVFYLRYKRAPSRGRYVTLLAWFLLGCQVDWQFYFLAPGIWIAELLEPKETRRLKPLLWLLPVGILGFLVVILHMRLAVGSFEVVIDQIKAAVSATQQVLMEDPEASASGGFLALQGANFRGNFGLASGILILAVLPFALLLPRWRRDPLTRLGVMFLAGGILTVSLFNRQAAFHEYFWCLAAAGCPLLVLQGGRLVTALIEGAGPARPLVRLSVVLVLVALSVLTLEGVWEKKEAFEGEGYADIAAQLDRLIDEQVGRDSCISSPEDSLRPALLYSKKRWTPPLIWPEKLRQILAARDAGRAGFKKLVVIVNSSSREKWPDLFSFLEQEAKVRNIEPIVVEDVLAYPF